MGNLMNDAHSHENSQVGLSVIIVNWNAGQLLRNCLDSLARTAADEIIVVDNASSDGSHIHAVEVSGIKLVRSKTNLGFGKACNLGALHANGKYLLFLNPDAAVFPGTLESVLEFMENKQNAGVGICGVQLVDEYGGVARSCSRFPSALGVISHALGFARFFPKLGQSMGEWSHDETRDVDQLIGAFFLVRRSVFEELGRFDERFFVYFEEVDFSLRARKAGWRSVYLANVQAFHSGGGTSHQVKARRLFYSLRSRLLYASKHFSGFGAAIVFVSTLFLEPLSRSVLALSQRSLPALKETWQGYLMLWEWLPKWVLKGITR